MAADPENAVRVNAWMASVPASPPAEVIAAFEHGLKALWHCARPAIEAPALNMMVTELLRDGAMRFPALAYASVGAAGIRVDELLAQARPEDAQQLREGTRYVLLQFINIVGHMTGGSLTPALRLALEDRVLIRAN